VTPDSSEFYPECGNPLSTSVHTGAPISDRTNLLQSYIPPELVKRVLGVGTQNENERRLVTVLLVGCATSSSWDLFPASSMIASRVYPP
jgi:hypothetical protein